MIIFFEQEEHTWPALDILIAEAADDYHVPEAASVVELAVAVVELTFAEAVEIWIVVIDGPFVATYDNYVTHEVAGMLGVDYVAVAVAVVADASNDKNCERLDQHTCCN